MTLAMAVNAVLILAVFVIVVTPLAWAIRYAHRDAPAGTAQARLEAGEPLVPGRHRPARARTARPRYRAAQPQPAA